MGLLQGWVIHKYVSVLSVVRVSGFSEISSEMKEGE